MAYEGEDRRKTVTITKEHFEEIVKSIGISNDKIDKIERIINGNGSVGLYARVMTFLDNFKTFGDLIEKKITMMDKNCLDRQEFYIKAQVHLDEANQKKIWWKDSQIRLLLALISPPYIVLIGIFIHSWFRK